MELVVRAAVMYVVLFTLVRMTGKRELAEMSAFEMVLLIVLGDVVQQAITQEDSSITGAVLTAGTLTLLVVLTSVGTYHSSRFRRLVDGCAVVVVRDGECLQQALRVERLTREEVLAAARQHGFRDLSKVEIGILEADGRFSFLAEREDEPSDEPPNDPPERPHL
jgi:uncharacterized membrane protein YcaP (DUF421 family)